MVNPITPDFDWGHHYTAGDGLRFGFDALICPFAKAVLERLRIVFPDLFMAGDFFGGIPDHLLDPEHPDFDAAEASRYFVFSATPPYDVTSAKAVSMLSGSTLAALAASEINGPLQLSFPLGTEGRYWEPAVLLDSVLPSIGVRRYLPFTWPMLQRLVAVLSFYFVESRDYAGFNPGIRNTKIDAYAAAYFPERTNGHTVTGNTDNPRQLFQGDMKRYGCSPPVLGWSMPNWPGPNGFTRKREREITRLDAPGEEGQRARFIYARPVSFGFIPFTGVGVLGQYGVDNGTASAHPAEAWIIDPKPLTRDVQIPPQPETPDDQRPLDTLFMDYAGGEWVVSEDQITPADTVTLYGFMQIGDILGPWILNELRDAINQLEMTCWLPSPSIDESGMLAIGRKDDLEQIGAFGRRRGLGFHNRSHFGPRQATFYRTHIWNSGSENPTFDGYVSFGQSPDSMSCLLQGTVSVEGDPRPEDAVNDYVAIVDWRSSLVYKSDTNPAACQSLWPEAIACTGTGTGTGGTGTGTGTGSGSGSGSGDPTGSGTGGTGTGPSGSGTGGPTGTGTGDPGGSGTGPGSGSGSGDPGGTCTFDGCSFVGTNWLIRIGGVDYHGEIVVEDGVCIGRNVDGPFAGVTNILHPGSGPGRIDFGGDRPFTCTSGVATYIDFGAGAYWHRDGGPGGGTGTGTGTGTGSGTGGTGTGSGTGPAPDPDILLVSIDESPSGDWHGVYGNEGYSIPLYGEDVPAYVEIFETASPQHQWTDSTDDPRALQKPADLADRIASTWYDSGLLTFTLQFDDDTTWHKVAFYLLDFDYARGTQRVLGIQGSDGVVDQTIDIAGKGVWVVFNIRRGGLIQFRDHSAGNIVCSGVFFGADADALP